ncbi:MAG: hypothetical protein WDO73_23935 [Ignavibacteriota bacterium]
MAKIADPQFIVYLASVNFQLGHDWHRKFKKTWDLILKGHYKEAAVEVAKSSWNSQTPKRVQDFQHALRKLPEKAVEAHAHKATK